MCECSKYPSKLIHEKSKIGWLVGWFHTPRLLLFAVYSAASAAAIHFVLLRVTLSLSKWFIRIKFLLHRNKFSITVISHPTSYREVKTSRVRSFLHNRRETITVLKFDYIIIIIDNWYLLHIGHLQNSYREFFCSSKCRQKIVQFSNTCTRCELSIFRTVAHLHEALCYSIRFPPVEVLQNIFSYVHTHALSAIFHPFWKLPSWSFHESCKW